jgi:hypothetical protein
LEDQVTAGLTDDERAALLSALAKVHDTATALLAEPPASTDRDGPPLVDR